MKHKLREMHRLSGSLRHPLPLPLRGQEEEVFSGLWEGVAAAVSLALPSSALRGPTFYMEPPRAPRTNNLHPRREYGTFMEATIPQ